MISNTEKAPLVPAKQSGLRSGTDKQRHNRNARSFGRASFLVLGIFIFARGLIFPFLPCKQWGDSAYSCASPYLDLPLGRARTFIAQKAFGAGARVANRLDFVAYRPEEFTIDARGYRNPASPVLTTPQVILSGSSFSLGITLNDESTLSAQLNQQLGPIVYNAATIQGYDDMPYQTLKRISRELGMNQGWVLLELNNRRPYKYKPTSSREESVSLGRYQKARIEDDLRRWMAPAHNLFRRVVYCSALHRFSALVNMRLENDHWLPNPYKSVYAEEELESGKHMLFELEDKEWFSKPPNPDATAAEVIRFRDDLSRDGLRLAVLLVPSSYTVYYPLLQKTQGPDLGAPYLGDLAKQLEANGIPVFNTLSSLRATASTELMAGKLIYWPDDLHWNAVGCATAAHNMAPWLRELLSRQPTLGQQSIKQDGNSLDALQ